MPFQSQAQRGWMYSTHPEMAERWEKETPKKKLPYHKKKTKKKHKKHSKKHSKRTARRHVKR